MIKHISEIRKLVLVLSPVMVIIFAIPIPLFAQNLPLPKPDPNRGLPSKTGGAGGRVKPEKIDPTNSEPILEEESGDYNSPFINNPGIIKRRPPKFYRRGYKKIDRLTFPLAENIKKQSLKFTSGKAGVSCVNPEKGKPFLTALIPPQENIAKTSKNNSTLLVYLPKTTATIGEFFLVNDKNKEIYQQKIQLPTTQGIIKIKLPESVKLENDKTYQWYFAVVCDLQDRSKDEYVKGMIQKIQLDPKTTNDLLKVTPLEKAKIYARNQIWYDTLEAIAEVKKEHPLDWESLLESVGLQELSQESVIDCCIVNK